MKPRLLIGASIALVLPALAIAGGGFLDGLLATHFEAAIADVLRVLGLTSASPLEVRRIWFAGIFIAAPLGACALSALAIPLRRPRQALPVAGLALLCALVAMLGVVRSFD